LAHPVLSDPCTTLSILMLTHCVNTRCMTWTSRRRRSFIVTTHGLIYHMCTCLLFWPVYKPTPTLNSTIFNDLERPQTQISRSGHSLTLNISKMAKDTAIVTMDGKWETIPKLSNGTIFSDLEWPLTHTSQAQALQGHHNIQRRIIWLIVSLVWSIEWCRFQWPSMTPNLDFKVTVLLPVTTGLEFPRRIVCAADARSVCDS